MLRFFLAIFAPKTTQHRSTGRNYLLAFLWTILMILVRLELDPYLGSDQEYLFPLFAVVVAAWLGGFGPALIALTVGFIGSLYFVALPRGNFSDHRFVESVGTCRIGLFGDRNCIHRRDSTSCEGESAIDICKRANAILLNCKTRSYKGLGPNNRYATRRENSVTQNGISES